MTYMTDGRTCPRCGCRAHLRESSGKYICDGCGSEVLSEREIKMKEQYALSVAKAKEHLQVGNWDSCISIVKPMLNDHPSDSLLYLLMLAGLTHGYGDYLMDSNTIRLDEAAAVWEKLERLNTVNLTMRKYASARSEMIHKALSSRLTISSVLTIGIIIGILVSISSASIVAIAIVSIIIIFSVKEMVKNLKPFSSLKEITREKTSNPFK